MKNKLIYGFLAIFIVGLLSLSFVSAENAAPAADLQALVQQLQNQIKELQDQLAKLKTEVQEAKEELKLTKNRFFFRRFYFSAIKISISIYGQLDDVRARKISEIETVIDALKHQKS